MWDYITQQEKKDELLGLYRNLSMETDVFERSKYWEQINKIELEELKMTYEIGQKVETPLGVGEIVGVIEYPKGYGNTYRVDIKIKEEVINKMYEL